MRVGEVPAPLRQVLGPEATDGLISAFDRARREWKDDVREQVADRFERRLTQELSGFRIEFREALAAQRSEFREALTTQGADLRTTMAEQGAALRGEIAGCRSELVRWLFVFWVGQVIALAALMNALV